MYFVLIYTAGVLLYGSILSAFVNYSIDRVTTDKWWMPLAMAFLSPFIQVYENRWNIVGIAVGAVVVIGTTMAFSSAWNAVKALSQ